MIMHCECSAPNFVNTAEVMSSYPQRHKCDIDSDKTIVTFWGCFEISLIYQPEISCL
jgi:hypothetical protein